MRPLNRRAGAKALMATTQPAVDAVSIDLTSDPLVPNLHHTSSSSPRGSRTLRRRGANQSPRALQPSPVFKSSGRWDIPTELNLGPSAAQSLQSQTLPEAVVARYSIETSAETNEHIHALPAEPELGKQVLQVRTKSCTVVAHWLPSQIKFIVPAS
eukprot:SAG31_NODE_847_length_11532_cov_2.297560_5_plen_156_part_00